MSVANRTLSGELRRLILPSNSITGPSATAFLEWLTPSALSELKPFHSTLSVLLNDKGGIIDDTVICKHSDDKYYVVTNAGRRVEDLAWFEQKLKEWNASDKSSSGKVSLEVLDGWGLVALQGLVSTVVCEISRLNTLHRSRSCEGPSISCQRRPWQTILWPIRVLRSRRSEMPRRSRRLHWRRRI